MGPLEIAVIIIAVGIVVAVVIAAIVRKLKGKPSLSSDCCGCPYSKDCDHNCKNHNIEQ